jgi:Antitoxin VbhA
MNKSTKAERRYFNAQALSSTRIEGHVPSAEFIADCEAVVEGTMTSEQARTASISRALASVKDTVEQ